MNLLVVLIVVVEAIPTRFSNGLPHFSPMNIKSALLGASAGGTALSDAVGARPDGEANRGPGVIRVVVGGRKRLATITVGTGKVLGQHRLSHRRQ